MRYQFSRTDDGSIDFADLTLDHVEALANGGVMLPDISLVEVLCRSCNSTKGTRDRDAQRDDDRDGNPTRGRHPLA